MESGMECGRLELGGVGWRGMVADWAGVGFGKG